MTVLNLSLMAYAASVSAHVLYPVPSFAQRPLESTIQPSFECDLPPVLDPAGDGLPSADSMFSSHGALMTQVKRHQNIVRVPSICFDDLGEFDEDARWEPFYDLHDTLAKTYPAVHEHAKLEKINRFGLLYTIQGSDASLKPTMLTAHQDVVPVADASTWTHPPFDAYYDGEWLWGRGSSDDKNSLTALMSAVETLLANGWAPRRTVLLAFGFDEECSGLRGARTISEHLEARYGRDSMAMVLDEGGLGISTIGNVRYALPSVTEKGHVDIWFELHVQGGHSSVPFAHTGIGIVSEMVAALEAHPYAPELLVDSPVYKALTCQARYSPESWPGLGEQLRSGDLGAVTEALVDLSPASHFMIQTSQAVDFIEGGQKINAMPEVIKLGVNYRVAPQDSIAKVQHNVVSHIDGVVNKYNLRVAAFEGDERYAAYVAEHAPEDGPAIEPRYETDYNGQLVLEAREASDAAPTSPTSGAVWDVLSGTIQHTFAFEDGPTVPVGQLMTGNTDTRHYLDLTPHIYRFTPVLAGGSVGAHTIDERVRMDVHMEMLKFYYDVIRNFDAADI